MKVGDLIRVRYADGVDDLREVVWTEPYHGIIFETPDMGEFCVWRMWCIERGKEHILAPARDQIEVVNEVNISNRHRRY